MVKLLATLNSICTFNEIAHKISLDFVDIDKLIMKLFGEENNPQEPSNRKEAEQVLGLTTLLKKYQSKQSRQ